MKTWQKLAASFGALVFSQLFAIYIAWAATGSLSHTSELGLGLFVMAIVSQLVSAAPIWCD